MAKRSARAAHSAALTKLELVVDNVPIPVGEVLPDDGLVAMVKGDDVLRVHPLTVAQHIRLGWSVWPVSAQTISS